MFYWGDIMICLLEMQLTDLYLGIYRNKQESKNYIDISLIKEYIPDIYATDKYGSILHALVDKQFREDEGFKILKILLDNKVDVNYRSEIAGYTFIHLALYGYTNFNGFDYSYSTEFIVKLINLANKYNFDVNIKDNDGDTIIHTALASEIYTGKIMPLIKALGSSFDIYAKDNKGQNIYEALLSYKKEAEIRNKYNWLNRLIEEEHDIDVLINSNKDSLSLKKKKG